jgi:hypothetical protein|nr:hypothetical protein [uncultured Psychroserpens sp.]
MKRVINILFFIVSIHSINAQNKSVKKVLTELNGYLEVYEKLTPHGDNYYSLAFLKLKKQDLINEFDEPLTQVDSLSNFDALAVIQSKIDNSLRQVLLHKKAKTINFRTALRHNLGVVKSEDNKLYNFSLFEKTGGSYHSFLSWMFYLDGNDFIEFPVNDNWSLNQDDKPTVFEANGYDMIKSFIANNKMRYLLFGSTKACGACFVEFVTFVHFENGEFILDFEYAVDSRSSESKLFFDATNLSLSVFYDTDDLTTECYCSNELDDENTYEDEDDDIDEIKNYTCSCLFIYDGGTFKLSKQVKEVIKN